YGMIIEPGTLRIQRLLPGPIERVWAYLTESDKRGLWLASGDMELRDGGGVTLRFVHADLSSVAEPTPEPYKPYENGVTTHGVITRCEPPRLLAFTWGGSQGQPSEVT
ncbi:SRPBCC domain-containing protein, partial [Escherichia coli]|uniref:SRPBCC domain-containing protein n=1 Tax=Escherichia coli TaxID=562 RepID=UPI002284B2C3